MGQLTPGPIVPPASLAASRAFADLWEALPARTRIARWLDAGPDPDEDTLAARVATLFADIGWLDELLAPLLDALRADPWFEPPLRTSTQGRRRGAILHDGPAVSLAIGVVGAAVGAQLLPDRLLFSGRLGLTCYVRAAGARLRCWEADPVPAVLTADRMGRCRRRGDVPLHDGAIVRHDGRRLATQLIDASGPVVTLTATIRIAADPVVREYDRARGDFVRMATSDDGAARAEMLLAFLRASAAAGAGACFDAATRDPAFFLRWSAMREWLAHDWREALPRLRELAAADPHPDIRAGAATMLARIAPRLAA